MDVSTFWATLDRSGDCWEWSGRRLPNGYARFWLNGRQTYAHRAAYELAVGPIPEGWDVCHRCDNPPCARPDHLFVGTHQDNMKDKAAKITTWKPDWTVNPGEIIREAIEERGWTVSHAADLMGVSQPFMSMLCAGRKGIGPSTALRLEDLTGVPAEFWARLWAQYAVAVERNRRSQGASEAAPAI